MENEELIIDLLGNLQIIGGLLLILCAVGFIGACLLFGYLNNTLRLFSWRYAFYDSAKLKDRHRCLEWQADKLKKWKGEPMDNLFLPEDIFKWESGEHE